MRNQMRLVDVRASQLVFGFSALRECLRGIEVFLNPVHHAEQMPWVREARRRVRPAERARLEKFRFFFEPRIETFAFAWPDDEEPSFAAELRELRAARERYRDAVVKRLSGARLFTPADLRRLRRPSWYERAAAQYAQRAPRSAAMLEEFVASPARSHRAFCDAVEEFYARTVAHRWDAIVQRLGEDVAMRRRVLRDHGVAALLRTLSREMTVTGSGARATVECPPAGGELRLPESGAVVLTPSFFCWPHVQALVEKGPGTPRATIAYPMPPLPARARRSPETAVLLEACGALADPARLRIVELLRARDCSTRELAGFLRLSEPAVSRHLHRLAAARLVERRRDGYFVLYRLRRDAVERLAAALSGLSSG